jgi:hypothetical protein
MPNLVKLNRLRYWARPVGAGIFLFTITSILSLDPTHSLTQWILHASSLRIKHLEYEADHSAPSSAKVKNVCSSNFRPHFCFYGTRKLSLPFYLNSTLSTTSLNSSSCKFQNSQLDEAILYKRDTFHTVSDSYQYMSFYRICGLCCLISFSHCTLVFPF